MQRVVPPTLVLELADSDEVEEFGLQGETVASLLPDGARKILENTDVTVFNESPRIVPTEVLEFLAE